MQENLNSPADLSGNGSILEACFSYLSYKKPMKQRNEVKRLVVVRVANVCRNILMLVFMSISP